MAQIVIVLTIFFALLFGFNLLFNKNKLSNEQKKKVLLGGLIGLVLILILTGRVHWLTGLVVAVFGLAKALFPILLRHLPQLATLYASIRSKRSEQNKGYQQESGRIHREKAMSREEAFEILGVHEGATPEQIQTAYKRLMQKCHPDRGGSDYLAAQLNAAKKVLLG